MASTYEALTKRVWIVVLGCVVVVHAGCVAPRVSSHVIHEAPTSFVRLEVSPTYVADNPATFHTHPAVVTTEQLTRAFQGLHVRDHRSAILLWFMEETAFAPAFRPDELDYLSRYVAEGLAAAASDQVITFYLSVPLNAVTREVTSGSVAVNGEQLSILLSNYRAAYRIPPFGVVYDRRYPSYSLGPRDFDVSFQPEGYMVPQTAGVLDWLLGREREGRVILDLSRLSAVQL